MTTSFTGAGVGTAFLLAAGQTADYAITNTYTGRIYVDISDSPTQAWTQLVEGVDAAEFSGTIRNDSLSNRWYRFRAEDSANGDAFSGTADCDFTNDADLIRQNAVETVTDAGVAITGTLAVTGEQLTTAGVGAKNGSTVSVAEYGNGTVHKTVLTLTDTLITLTDDPGQGQYGGVKLYDFPAGNILVLGATIDADILLLTPFIDTAEGDVGLGTAAPSVGTALTGTKQNIVATTAIAALVAKAGPIDAQSVDVAPLSAAGAADSDLYLNVRIDDDAAHTTTAGNKINGTVTVIWTNCGDF